METSLRQSLTRKLIAAGALLMLGAPIAFAQVQPASPGADPATTAASGNDVIETIAAVVQGLSGDDLLNVRATASPIGLVLARIPNGTMLVRLECSTSRNTEWCRVEVPDLDGLVGWTPARYLRVARGEGEAADDAPAPLPDPKAIDPSQITVGILPDPMPMPADPLADPAPAADAGEPDLQTALLSPATNGPPSFDAAREAEKIDGAAADLALSYATRDDPASSEVYSAVESVSETDEATATDAPEEPAAATVADDAPALAVPVPSPRPPREDESEPSTESSPLVAALPSSDTEAPRGTETASDPAAQAPSEGGPASTTPGATSSTPFVPSGTLALSAAPPGDLARPSEENTELASSRAVVATQDDGDSEPTLREQLAALLPAWTRPVEPVPTESEPEPGSIQENTESATSDGEVPLAEPTEDAAATAEAPEPATTLEASAEPQPVTALPVTVAETPAGAPDPEVLPDTTDATTDGRTAEIPCARYVGQPMTTCQAQVLRIGDGDADVTVEWPDGGTRLIRFRGGQPESTNGRGEFRFTREAELSLIRIGSGERFEILDAVPFAE